MKTELDIYLEWNKDYDKVISRLMKLSNKKSIQTTKENINKIANDYISKFTEQHYINRITEDIKTINENF